MPCPCLLFDVAGPVITVFETACPAANELGRRAGEFIGIFPARALAKRLSANANTDVAYERDELRGMCLIPTYDTVSAAVALLSATACAAAPAAAVLTDPTAPRTVCTPGASFQDEYIRYVTFLLEAGLCILPTFPVVGRAGGRGIDLELVPRNTLFKASLRCCIEWCFLIGWYSSLMDIGCVVVFPSGTLAAGAFGDASLVCSTEGGFIV